MDADFGLIGIHSDKTRHYTDPRGGPLLVDCKSTRVT